jgi:hypothetical protein
MSAAKASDRFMTGPGADERRSSFRETISAAASGEKVFGASWR